MNGVLKFYNAEKDITVTLTLNGDGYDFVILGDEGDVTDAELLKMSTGKSFGGWTLS